MRRPRSPLELGLECRSPDSWDNVFVIITSIGTPEAAFQPVLFLEPAPLCPPPPTQLSLEEDPKEMETHSLSAVARPHDKALALIS